MGLIANSKHGDCDRCPAKNTQVRKRKKEYVCLQCCRTEDVEKQLEKQKAKQKLQRTLSSLKNTTENKEAVRREQGKVTERGNWYLERRKEMTNACCECGRGTNKNNDKFFTWSICHIVPKGLVPSVATNEYNWIELCQLHHQEFDSTFDRAEKMMCFGEVKMKFQLFKNLIPPEQLRKVNPHLLK